MHGRLIPKKTLQRRPSSLSDFSKPVGLKKPGG